MGKQKTGKESCVYCTMCGMQDQVSLTGIYVLLCQLGVLITAAYVSLVETPLKNYWHAHHCRFQLRT